MARSFARTAATHGAAVMTAPTAQGFDAGQFMSQGKRGRTSADPRPPQRALNGIMGDEAIELRSHASQLELVRSAALICESGFYLGRTAST